MKLPKTIRFDESDDTVFPAAARAGEWAVTGTFAFVDADPDGMSAKERQAFRNGWMGTKSFGFATLVRVVEIAAETVDDVADDLANHLVEAYGAPNWETAAAAARGEIDTTAGLCGVEPGTLLAIEREMLADGIIERVRVIEMPATGMAADIRIWQMVEDGDD